jgi:hypothetical protein
LKQEGRILFDRRFLKSIESASGEGEKLEIEKLTSVDCLHFFQTVIKFRTKKRGQDWEER